ncbi:MAG TPA: hypothetical protein VFW20_03900 [Candidatus Limnocylindrales bacterium]|nr:hypothetical protein [Candidatus Limnocylindrales bacterium]
MISNLYLVTAVLVVIDVLAVVLVARHRGRPVADFGDAAREARFMRTASALVALSLVSFGFQVAFSDGATPIVTSLPIGILPLQLGLILAGLGFLIGVAGGSSRYRLAVIIGVIGSGLIVLTFLDQPFTGPPGTAGSITLLEVDLALAVVACLLAIGIAIDELRKPMPQAESAEEPRPGD